MPPTAPAGTFGNLWKKGLTWGDVDRDIALGAKPLSPEVLTGVKGQVWEITNKRAETKVCLWIVGFIKEEMVGRLRK